MVQSAANILRKYSTLNVPSSGLHKPRKADLAAWGTYVEALISSGSLSSANWQRTSALLSSELNHDDGTIGVVFEDGLNSNNGLWRKVGASGSGSWEQLTSFLPGYQFVYGTDNGNSTDNIIRLDTNPIVPAGDGSALISFVIPNTNTGTNVTVSFNGSTALAIRNATGGLPDIGELVQGAAITGIVVGNTFRMTSGRGLKGEKGDQGDKGDDGNIEMVAGDYDPAALYDANTIVLYQGSTFISLQQTQGNLPPNLPATNNASWQMIAQAGQGAVDSVNGFEGAVNINADQIPEGENNKYVTQEQVDRINAFPVDASVTKLEGNEPLAATVNLDDGESLIGDNAFNTRRTVTGSVNGINIKGNAAGTPKEFGQLVQNLFIESQRSGGAYTATGLGVDARDLGYPTFNNLRVRGVQGGNVNLLGVVGANFFLGEYSQSPIAVTFNNPNSIRTNTITKLFGTVFDLNHTIFRSINQTRNVAAIGCVYQNFSKFHVQQGANRRGVGFAGFGNWYESYGDNATTFSNGQLTYNAANANGNIDYGRLL